MTRSLFFALFLVVFVAHSSVAVNPIPGTGSLKSAQSSKFSFIVAGDNRPASADLPQPDTLKQIFEAAKKEKVDFIVWTGDTIFGLDYADPKAIAKQYKEYFELAKSAGVPVFVAPGNHEMDVKVKHAKKDHTIKEVGSAAMEKLFRKNMRIKDNDTIYGAFSYGNARFILLNSEEIAPDDVVRSESAEVSNASTGQSVNLDPGYMSDAQLNWLSSELSANKATHTFLFMHHPIKPMESYMALNKANADALVSLFAKHDNISYVFASHEHLYYNPQTKDASPPQSRTAPSKEPPVYLVSGGAGAPLGKGGFHHYILVSVDGNTITPKMVRLP